LNTKLATKPTEVQVPVDKIVTVADPATQAELDKAMDFIHTNVNEDITVSYIMFETDSQIEAEAYIRAQLASLLDDNNMFDSGYPLHDYRKSEVSVRHLSDPILSEQDYTKKDVTFTYDVKVRAYADKDNKEDITFKIVVPFTNGNLDNNDITVEQE
jgi:hypothetical protein